MSISSARTMRGLLVVIASCCLLVLGTPAQAAQEPLGMDQCIQMGLGYAPNVEQRLEEITKAQNADREAFTGYLPKASMAWQWTHTDDPTATYGNSSAFFSNLELDQDTNQWSATVTQPVFTGFRTTALNRISKLGVDVAQINLETARLDVALAVKEAYFNLLRTQKGLTVAQSAVTQLEAQVKSTQDFFEVGLVPKNDVLKAQVELANAQQELIAADNAVKVARARLGRLLGMSVDAQVQVVDELRHQPLSLAYEAAQDTAKDQRPEFQVLKLQTQQAEEQVRVAQSEYYPQVNLQGSYSYYNDSPEPENDTWQVVAQVDWSVFEWGATGYKVNQNRAQVRILESAMRDLKDQVSQEVKEAYLYLREAEANISTAQASVTSAQENFRITTERFKEQLTTNTEVLDAQTLLTRAQRSYYDTLSVFNIAKARLQRAMGQGLPASDRKD